ncbi:MAG TPA: hypothetical protein P5279_18060, partial [Anaerohalosphaeraceae bacterium]|nr:hypothetical protein [Anaerohalosphaeraceae bacterium]HRT52399.1 hypothetical protein [Anaerohalosphaeraceae bacterium]HRT88428.1 hypothetical protein [Anaerohalosphaeraceae bacterium]
SRLSRLKEQKETYSASPTSAFRTIGTVTRKQDRVRAANKGHPPPKKNAKITLSGQTAELGLNACPAARYIPSYKLINA